MNSKKYPQITVRLTPTAEKDLRRLARSRSRSHGQIVREALALYASVNTKSQSIGSDWLPWIQEI